MKKETKELIDWIKKQINLAKDCCIKPCHEDGYKEYNEDYDKAMNFLDSLPQIESHLCKGGYIQDKNGTPSCNGDEVVFTYYDDYYDDCTTILKKKGQLIWSFTDNRFVILEDANEYDFDDIIEFEKITEEKQ